MSVRLYDQRMYVCLFIQIHEEFATNIACDTCCDVTQNKRNVFKIQSQLRLIGSLFNRVNRLIGTLLAGPE